jgi:sugar/nucleoside kinase (ribokinase family)
MFTGETNLPSAARAILEYGPEFVVVKKGEHGALCASDSGFAVLAAFPALTVVDPTGAGDSFAGGMMGCLAAQDGFSDKQLRTALVYGTVMASINIEDFSLQRLQSATREDIEARRAELETAVRFV